MLCGRTDRVPEYAGQHRRRVHAGARDWPLNCRGSESTSGCSAGGKQPLRVASVRLSGMALEPTDVSTLTATRWSSCLVEQWLQTEFLHRGVTDVRQVFHCA